MLQIIGAGAIGSMWAGSLLCTNQDIHLVTRMPLKTNLLNYQDINQHHHQLAISTSCSLLKSTDPIVLCVKATQVQQAIKDQRHLIHPEQAIILMHNGMGCAEQVQVLLPDNPIISATTANASLLNAPLDVHHLGKGPTYLGPFNQAAESYEHVADIFNHALGDSEWTTDIKQKQWLKLLINSVINPLTALYEVKNGELKSAFFQDKMANIILEGINIARAESLHFSQTQLINIINQVISNTSENYSSMNRDIFYKRQTENEYIIGYLLDRAKKHTLVTPYLLDLYQGIQKAEN